MELSSCERDKPKVLAKRPDANFVNFRSNPSRNCTIPLYVSFSGCAILSSTP